MGICPEESEAACAGHALASAPSDYVRLGHLVYKRLLAALQNACACLHLYRPPLSVAVGFVSDTSLRSCLSAGLPGFYAFLDMASLKDQPSRQ
jgi:hypothetical protein